MRIVSGKYRHRLIKYPENNPSIRPTKDMVREGVFSALGDITSKTVLDLFAGSGSMGIEALSRGASHCYFVDHADVAISVVKDNVKALAIDNATIIKKEAEEAISSFIDNNIKFDVVILDPPYALDTYIKIIKDIIDNGLINPKGVFVVESNGKLSYEGFDFNKVKRYHYGKTYVDILWS